MCLVGMTMFLRRIGDIMSLVKCEPHFRPGFNGLKDLYDDQWKLLTRNGFRDSGQLRMAVGIPRVGEFSIYGAEHHEPARRTDLNMDRATHLFLNGGQAEFANNPIEDGGQQCTALSRGGLCIWLDCLSALRADAESMSVINIVAGQIIHKENVQLDLGPHESNWARTLQDHGMGYQRLNVSALKQKAQDRRSFAERPFQIHR